MYTLHLLSSHLAVYRLDADAPLPDWAHGELVALVRTSAELSVVCEALAVPAEVKYEPGWRALKVAGTLDFALVGVLAELTGVLARAGVSIFAISTYDTDYILVKESSLGVAMAALRHAGHQVFSP